MHVGHARTFWTAHQRAAAAGGTLLLRIEDLDPDRCRSEFAAAALADLSWLGLRWQEGPDVGGAYGPYVQSQRLPYYLTVWRQLYAAGAIYPSPHSRKDVDLALLAPHETPPASGPTAGDEAAREPIFPVGLRPAGMPAPEWFSEPGQVNWRFRVPDGEVIRFGDGRVGETCRTAGVDFGDFLVWRRDGFPSYELAVVADDHSMQVSEVVRGEDLLTSTARQLLLYRALGWQPPAFFHCPLVLDANGRRLAKRAGAVALRTLRDAGRAAEDLRAD